MFPRFGCPPVLDAFCLSRSACPALPVLLCLSRSACPVLLVPFCLSVRYDLARVFIFDFIHFIWLFIFTDGFFIVLIWLFIEVSY
jgi:hypothetical protein